MNEISFSRTVKEVKFGAWTLDPKRQTINDGEIERELEPLLFKILCYLLIHNERIVTRQDLVDDVWCQKYVDDNAINRAMSELRKVLKSQKQRGLVVKTHYRKGYSFFLDRDIIYHDEVVVASVTPNSNKNAASESQNTKTRIATFISIVVGLSLLMAGWLFVGRDNTATVNEASTAQIVEPQVKKQAYVKQTLFLNRGSFLRPELHPNERFIAVSYKKDKQFSGILIRDLLDGKEKFVSIDGKIMKPIGWAADHGYLFYVSFFEEQCQLWRMDFIRTEQPHQYIQPCSKNTVRAAGVSDDKVVYSQSEPGFETTQSSAVYVRNIKNEQVTQLTFPQENIENDDLLYLDEKNNQIYFSRRTPTGNKIMRIDMEGNHEEYLVDADKVVFDLRVIDGHLLSWFSYQTGEIKRFDATRKAFQTSLKIDDATDYFYAIPLSDQSLLAITQPFTQDIVTLDLDDNQSAVYANTPGLERLFIEVNGRRAYLIDSYSFSNLVVEDNQGRSVIPYQDDKPRRIFFTANRTQLILVHDDEVLYYDTKERLVTQRIALGGKFVAGEQLTDSTLGFVVEPQHNSGLVNKILTLETGQFTELNWPDVSWFDQVSDSLFVLRNHQGVLALWAPETAQRSDLQIENDATHIALSDHMLVYRRGSTVYKYNVLSHQKEQFDASLYNEGYISALFLSREDNLLYVTLDGLAENQVLLLKPDAS